MRSKILSYFLNHPGEYISGEKISEDLNISRAAVWKHLKALKEEGYQFDSQSRKGYLLQSIPDLVSEELVVPRLLTKYLGRRYKYFKEVDSTNQKARELANQGAPEGTVVISETQNQGKGRLQRGWFSPMYKGIWLSLILRPHFLPQEAPKMTLLIAVAIAKVLRANQIPIGIKWPNDLLLEGRKMVGILTELSAEIEQIHYVIVGIGININIAKQEFPLDLQESATSLQDFSGRSWRREKIVAEILAEIEKLYDHVLENGFAEVFRLWKEMNITLGSEVRVLCGDGFYEGVATDLDASGALWVQKNDGTKELVQAGDVSIRSISKN